MTHFSTRLQRWCSYSGNAGRDDFLCGSIALFLFAIPYFFVGMVFLTGQGFEPDTPAGLIGVHIWLIPYQLFWHFPLVMRRWRDLNGKLHARWVMVYFLWYLLPELSDISDNRFLTITSHMITFVVLYPTAILIFARGEKWKRIQREKRQASTEVVAIKA